MQERQQCPLCLKTGLINYLQSYQINLEEAVVLCQNKLCPYPLAQSSTVAATFTRRFEEVSSGRGNEEDNRIPDSQVALQTKVASHMRKFGHRLQKDAVGIQTGSPQLKKALKAYNRKPHKKRGTTPTLHRQTGSNNLPELHLPQNGSLSFQNFKPFSEKHHIPGATNGAAWNSCNGSEGSSDKDSSLDSLESNSSSSSNSSVGDGSLSAKRAKYPAFQFDQCNTMSSPKSLPSLKKSSHMLQLDGHSIEIEDERADRNFLNVGKVEQLINTKQASSTVSLSSKFEVIEQCKMPVQEIQNGHKSKDPEESKKLGLHQLQQHSHYSGEINTCSFGEKGDYLLRYPSVFPQWRNKDALCWLDVILCLAVHNETLKTLVFSDGFDRNNLIYKLLKAHNQACHLLQKSQLKCKEHHSNQTIEMDSPPNVFEESVNQAHKLNGVCKESKNPADTSDNCTCSDKARVEDMLDEVREEVWNRLQCRLKCEKGDHESPVFALPLLLKEDKAVEQLFRMNYWFEYKCSDCGKYEKTDHSNTLPTFPAVAEDFRICDPQHYKKCSKCGNSKDARTMVYKKLPECLLMHFTDGLPDVSWAELQFGFHGYLYTVTGVVQYINSPDHFISWLRNPNENRWMKCDDLRPKECRYRMTEPKFPSSQIHIVMWERLQTKPRICRQVAMEMDMLEPSEDLVQEKAFQDRDTFSLNLGDDYTKVKLKEEFNDNVLSNTKKVISSSKCTNLQSVRSVESPCSTLSTESSDSVLLPNFISSTPASKCVLRPIPKPVFSVPALCMKTDGHSGNNVQLQEAHISESCLDPSNKSILNGIKRDQTVKNSILPDTSKANENEFFEDSQNGIVGKNCVPSTPASQICGPKSLIKPSTVFCVPKKSSEPMDLVISNDDKFVDVKQVKVNETGDNIGDAERELKNMKCEPIIEQNNIDSKKNSCVTKKNLKELGHEIEQSIKKSEKVSEKEVKDLADVKTSKAEPEKAKEQTTSSRLSHSSRFKVPFVTVKRPSVSRDAFFTLESNNSSANSSACSTPLSTSSTLSSGNLTFLNSVKQYLLNRTTGRTEQKFKFEGLNLRSASNRSSFASLPELDLPLPRNSSNSGSDLPTLSNSACDTIDNESECSSIQTASVSATDALVTELIERLEQGPGNGIQNPMTLKRKLESTSVKNPKKKLSNTLNELDKLSTGNISLKENSSGHHKKRTPGGKNMKLVRKLVKNAEKAKSEQKADKVHGDNDKKEHQNEAVNGIETKCDTETVLQDLYEALNIPFSSVNATMSDIMTDVDDILNFVNVGDVLPGQHHGGRPSLCFDDSFLGNQKHSDCWIRRPGRNSA